MMLWWNLETCILFLTRDDANLQRDEMTPRLFLDSVIQVGITPELAMRCKKE